MAEISKKEKMRTFVYFSAGARTSGNFDINNLMDAGRLHIEMHVNKDTSLSKKDVATLIKKVLYKYKPGQKTEAVPGCFIEKKSFLNVIEELVDEGKEIFILDKGGESLRKAKL